MKKKVIRSRKRQRQRRVLLDFRVCVVAVGAVAVLQFLLFFAGWITGQHAIEPMRLFANNMRVELAAMIAPDPQMPSPVPQPAPVAQLASLVPHTSSLVPEAAKPVRLVFEALPPVAPPKVYERPRPQTYSPDFYVELIRDAASRYDVPAALVQAVVKVESDFNARAVSPKGARGLMQLMPATARRFGVADPEHLFYPAPNLSAGTAYLAWLLKRYDNDLDLALAAYNAGEGAVETYRGIPPYRETQNYVKKVRKVLGRTSVDTGA